MDVHYPATGGARAALVVAADSRYGTIIEEHVASVGSVAAYRPGAFFARELPAILTVLADSPNLDVLIVDGYVSLDPAGRPGLGAHVHREIGVPVIGVAKNPFRTATHAVPVCRGRSTRPLYVTAAGMPVERAAALVAGMAGAYRIPDALRRVDRLARDNGYDRARPADRMNREEISEWQ